MASLKSQLEKATLDLNNAKYKREQALSLRDDTKYIKFKDRPVDEKKSINAKITEASANLNQAQKYYDNILKAYNKELETKKITGQIDGLTEEDQAANLGITVEQLRTNKEAALTEQQKKERDAARAAGASVNTGNVPIEDFLKNLDAAGGDKVNEIKTYLGIKNLDGKLDYATIIAIYAKEKEIETVADATGKPVDRVTYYRSAPKTEKDAVPTTTISPRATATTYIDAALKSLGINRDATPEEIDNLTKVLNDAESRFKTTIKNGVTRDLLGNRQQFIENLITTGKYVDPNTGKPIKGVKEDVKKAAKILGTLSKSAQTFKADTRSLTVQTLQSTANANGVSLSPQQLEQYALEVQNGKDIKVIQSQIRNIAGLGMPDNIKKLLAEGTDLDTVYAPYKTQMAAILEVNPQTISFTDPALRSAIGPNGEMPIYDFQRALRKDARWQYTNNAREDVFQSVGKVLQDFGFQG